MGCLPHWHPRPIQRGQTGHFAIGGVTDFFVIVRSAELGESDGVRFKLLRSTMTCYRLFCGRKNCRIVLVGIFYNPPDWHRNSRPNCHALIARLRQDRPDENHRGRDLRGRATERTCAGDRSLQSPTGLLAASSQTLKPFSLLAALPRSGGRKGALGFGVKLSFIGKARSGSRVHAATLR